MMGQLKEFGVLYDISKQIRHWLLRKVLLVPSFR